jgi:hypothetical protein
MSFPRNLPTSQGTAVRLWQEASQLCLVPRSHECRGHYACIFCGRIHAVLSLARFAGALRGGEKIESPRTPKAGGRVDPHRLTQLGRALQELGIKMIPAYSPQARGRMERSYRTWQGRFPQELRIRQIQ